MKKYIEISNIEHGWCNVSINNLTYGASYVLPFMEDLVKALKYMKLFGPKVVEFDMENKGSVYLTMVPMNSGLQVIWGDTSLFYDDIDLFVEESLKSLEASFPEYIHSFEYLGDKLPTYEELMSLKEDIFNV